MEQRVQIYLPIADLPVNIFLVLAMGLAVGFISGMFGIGGGFLLPSMATWVTIMVHISLAPFGCSPGGVASTSWTSQSACLMSCC